jgi:hypothetical protein
MKKIIFFFCTLVICVSCEKEDYDIPRDAAGNAVLTGVSSATTTGISSLDDSFTVNAHVPNAKAGDVMTAECLQLQLAPDGTTTQLFPLSGTQKQVTVGSDLKVSVSYTRQEAKLNKPGDYVTVTFAGDTDYALQRVDMVAATTTTRPMVVGVTVDVARTAETAYFNVTVAPKSGAYDGTLVVRRKSAVGDPWVEVGVFSGAQPFLVPVSGSDFVSGKDTLHFSFTSGKGAYSDEIMETVIVREPYFYLKKAATLARGGSSVGRNILINAAVPENNAAAMIVVSESLVLQGGSTWLGAGNKIEFVPATAALYAANSVNETIAAFNAGTPVTSVNPTAGSGVYIFRITNGPAPTDVYFGILTVTAAIPDVSVAFEYRIGNMYAHLAVIK